MGKTTGDLLPKASGSASLGTEQVDSIGGFNGDIRPYAHMHQLSGLWHHNGQSGVIRFGFDSLGNRIIQCSTDGGATFGFIAHSGQLQESIDAAVAGGTGSPHTIQAAYDGGNEANLDFVDGYKGIVVKENIPGALAASPDDILTQPILDYGIAVSGYASDPLNPHRFSFARLRSNALTINASGQLIPGTESNTLFLGFNSNLHSADATEAVLATSGNMLIDIEGSLDQNVAGLFTIDADDGLLFTSNQGQITHRTLEGNITLSSDANVLGDEDGLGGQLSLSAFGGSGQFQYRFGPYEAWHVSASHTSDFFPLAHSGQVLQMILENAVAGASTLDDAYENGSTISMDLNNPVLVHEPFGGLPILADLPPIDTFGSGPIAVSGFTLSPENPDTYSLTEVYPGLIYFKSSGVASSTDDTDRAHSTSFGYLRGSDPSLFSVASSGGLLWSTGGDTQVSVTDGTILLRTLSVNKVMRFVSRDDCRLEAFGNGLVGSGQLAYRMGPYQAWHVRQTHNNPAGGPNSDGFFPMPHSGQILQMILENGGGGGGHGLQAAYDGDPTVVITTGGAPDNMIITADNSKLKLSTFGTHAQLHMSGVLEQTTVNHELGDLNVLNHADVLGLDTASSLAESQAKSLGPGTMSLNTGSGIVNVATGSGIAVFRNTGGTQSTTMGGILARFNTEDLPDSMYAWDSSVTGVRFFVPGLYRIEANVNGTGGALQFIFGTIGKNGGAAIAGSAASEQTIGGSNFSIRPRVYVNVDAGDYAAVSIGHSAGAAATLLTGANASTLVVEYIGPQRTGLS